MTSKAFGLAQLGNAYSDGALGSRNRIINGAMTIDQRNAGAAVTGSGDSVFAVDRVRFRNNLGTGSYTVQQSTTAPVGFNRSFSATVVTPSLPASPGFFSINQAVEGYNAADLLFGTAAAKQVTVSFWVRSSLTGTYCVSLRNTDASRSIATEYQISAADTWEFKTVTIQGDTSGTWAVNNSAGIFLDFSLGANADRKSAIDTWVSQNSVATSNQVDWSNTSGATFYITGVQLEAGDTATPFEHRSYGAELALCQRYYQTLISGPLRMQISNTERDPRTISPEMRATPTLTKSFPSGSTNIFADGSAATSGRNWNIVLQISGFGVGFIDTPNYTVIASAEL